MKCHLPNRLGCFLALSLLGHLAAWWLLAGGPSVAAPPTQMAGVIPFVREAEADVGDKAAVAASEADRLSPGEPAAPPASEPAPTPVAEKPQEPQPEDERKIGARFRPADSSEDQDRQAAGDVVAENSAAEQAEESAETGAGAVAAAAKEVDAHAAPAPATPQAASDGATAAKRPVSASSSAMESMARADGAAGAADSAAADATGADSAAARPGVSAEEHKAFRQAAISGFKPEWRKVPELTVRSNAPTLRDVSRFFGMKLIAFPKGVVNPSYVVIIDEETGQFAYTHDFDFAKYSNRIKDRSTIGAYAQLARRIKSRFGLPEELPLRALSPPMPTSTLPRSRWLQ